MHPPSFSCCLYSLTRFASTLLEWAKEGVPHPHPIEMAA